ncbi:MAG: DNA polymerase III subunit gamma/tau [Xanthomonadales bacterium]
MSYQVLARKWRPKSFDQLVGQEHVSQALINGLDQDRVHHAFLFTGTRGVGKTTIARILAKCLNCDTGVTSRPCGECSSCVDIDQGRFIDMLEIDAASRTGVDDMRELLESAHYTPTRGRYKVYIIDEVHMLSPHSFTALLKTLEEPPPHVKFVLATTDPHKIPVTILSRCLRFNLRRLLPDQIGNFLKLIVESEGVEAESQALVSISRAADGSMRDGLSLLDQAIAYGAGKLILSDVENMLGLVDHAHISSMISALACGDAEALLAIVEELVAQSRDLETVLLSLAEVLHRVTLVQCVPGYRDPERSDWDAIAELGQLICAEDAQLFYQIAIKGRDELGLAPDPRTGLEMTLLRMLAFRPVSAASGGAGTGALKVVKPVASKTRQSTPAKPAAARSVTRPAGKQDADGQHEPELFSSPCSMPPVDRPQAAKTSSPATADWMSLQGDLEISGQVRELARNVQLQSRSVDRWEFVITPSLKHLGSQNCINRLGQAISRKIGHTVAIKLIDSDSTELITAAALDQHKNLQNRSEAEKAINDDPTVKALKEQLGARVVEHSIQPLQ